jgi:hypothetical protein
LKIIFKDAEIDVWLNQVEEILEGSEDVNDIIVFDDVENGAEFRAV